MKIRENISLRQAFIMLYIILTSGIMSIGGSGDAERDTWIAPIVAIIFVIALYYIYYKPFVLYKNLTYFEILDKVYSRFSVIINIFLGFNAFLLACISLSRFSIFLKTVSLNQTPLYVISLFMMVVCAYGVYSGFEVLARFSEILVWIIVAFLVFSTVISYQTLDFNNLYPILENGFLPVVNGTYTVLATPFMETFFLVMLFGDTKKRADMPKNLYKSAIVSSIVMSVVYLRNLLILGHPAIQSLYYPSYTAISLISLGDFFQRQEVFVSLAFLIADILKICVFIIYVCRTINHVGKTKEYKNYTVSVCVAVLLCSLVIFTNTMDLFNFLQIYRYVVTVPCLFVPILTTILCIKQNKNKTQKNKV